MKKTTTAIAISKEFLIETRETFKGEVFGELQKYAKEFSDFCSSLEYFPEAVDKTNRLMEKWNNTCKKIQKELEGVSEENKALKKCVSGLEQRAKDLEQYIRHNIKISGVPEPKGENTDMLLGDLAKVMDLS